MYTYFPLPGTDSRIGFGFAFGNHADFQVLLELGPQTNTNPIVAVAHSPLNHPTPPQSDVLFLRERLSTQRRLLQGCECSWATLTTYSLMARTPH
ncbi:hypothetical protein EVAR_78913_1 [Eumeta japonica]|uniref:Uncharacterized protein n=1 Tax=Eumeta variegata TaxID=151549 RepID=A0A4C1U3A2_EUMVA|nr:hypothetical protein EVAR_78913_1 [Eumeta japonica]